MQSNGYDMIDYLMEIYVDNVGRFIIDAPPELTTDGEKQYKHVTAKSAEWNFFAKDCRIEVNVGTSTSIERTIEGNVDACGKTLQYITFYNKSDKRFSLLDILLDYVIGWEVGYVSDSLKDKVPNLSVDATNVYSFIMQDLSKNLQCFFKFDTLNKTINAYDETELGEDTNVYISMRNLLNSISSSPITEQIYTRYAVYGDSELDIRQVNFGEEYVVDLSYYMTTSYVSQDIIDKYKSYLTQVESYRTTYMNASKYVAKFNEEISELTNRIPLDDLNLDWDEMELEKLESLKIYYEGLVETIEGYYTVDGVLDEDALKSSEYWWDYQSYTEWILPNIATAIENLSLSEDEQVEIDDSWKYDWDLYGVNELENQISLLSDEMTALEEIKCNIPWDSLTVEEQASRVKDTHIKNYQRYFEIEYALTTAKIKLSELEKKIADIQENLTAMEEIQKEKATQSKLEYEDYGFTQDEIDIIKSLYIDGEYTNENFVVTSYNTAEEQIDIAYELYKYAKEDIAKQSRPQYSITVNADNLFAMEEFKTWHGSIENGNFIRVSNEDGQCEKLRLIGKTFNPMLPNENNLTLTFSNMIKWNGNRSDLTDLLDNAMSTSKGSITRNSNQLTVDDLHSISAELIQNILNSKQFSDKITSTTTPTNPEQTEITESQINVILEYLKNNNIEVGGNITVDSELSETSENPVQNKVVTAKLNEVFQSVSDGKIMIASAITDKGVDTASDATFGEMASNIRSIQSGGIQSGGGSNGYITNSIELTARLTDCNIISQLAFTTSCTSEIYEV